MSSTIAEAGELWLKRCERSSSERHCCNIHVARVVPDHLPGHFDDGSDLGLCAARLIADPDGDPNGEDDGTTEPALAALVADEAQLR